MSANRKNFSIFTDESEKRKNTRIFNERKSCYFLQNSSMYCIWKIKIENCECWIVEIYFRHKKKMKTQFHVTKNYSSAKTSKFNDLKKNFQLNFFSCFFSKYIMTPVRTILFDFETAHRRWLRFSHVFLPIFIFHSEKRLVICAKSQLNFFKDG